MLVPSKVGVKQVDEILKHMDSKQDLESGPLKAKELLQNSKCLKIYT